MCLIIKLHPQGCLVIQGSLLVMPPAPTRPGTIFQFLQLKGCLPDSKSLRLKMEIFCWRKDLHFLLGNMKSHSLHFSCPPIRWVTVVLKWWPKERANYFGSHPCNFPWCHYGANWSTWLFYQILKSCVHGDWKYVYTGASAHRGPLGCLKRNSSHIYLFSCVCEQHVDSRDKGRSWLSPSTTWILRTVRAERSRLATS